MSPTIRHADARRTTARIALAIVVIVMMTLVLFSGGPIGAISFAQQTTPNPTIQFMNPDNDTSLEVTANNDGTDTAYHLVAWVNVLPANPRVEFKYQEEGQQEQTITENATRIGDTFEHFWQKTNMPPDGAYTLKATLYSGSTQVSQDTEEITVKNDPAADPPTPTDNDNPNAVEIVYPVNGGRVGFYANQGVWAAQIDVTASDGTEEVVVYYTTTPPGQDPEWIECGADDHSSDPQADDTQDGIPCALQEGDSPEEVNGIAAVAGDTGPPPLNPADTDSADAHRAFGYVQDPDTITVVPQTQSVARPAPDPDTGAQQPFPCSDFLVATVFDQFERRIVGANVDVHATGPVDRIAFDDPGTAEDDSSPHKAPDQGTHTTEPEANCEGDATAFDSASLQGEHDRGGTTDIKHIESAAAGTNEEGEFQFRMASSAEGITQITVWADEDGNDQFCSAEPNVDASISWGQDAQTTPSGLEPEQTTCPRPTGTGSGSSSPPSSESPSSPPPSSEPPPSSPPPSSPPPSSPPPDGRGCTLSGDDGDNTLRGTSGRDIICGNGGDDVIYGLGGDDLLYGDSGTDTIVGEDGDDEMYGGAGDDLMRGGDGSDLAFGGGGNDTINGKSGDDRLRGNGGRDVLTGGDQNDNLRGHSGKDVLKGGEHNDRLIGGPQGDVLRGLNGNDVLFGQGGPDSLNGGRHRDRCTGGPGRDRERNCER